eukprot:gene16323-22233_t
MTPLMAIGMESFRTNCRSEKEIKYSSFGSGSYPANNPSEDRWVAMENNHQNLKLAAVFDGHGGWQISEYASKVLPSILCRNLDITLNKSNDSQNTAVYDISAIDETITNTFIAMEKEIISIILPAYRMGFGDCSSVGSCVLIAVQTSDNRLVVMNCGDCRAILGTEVKVNNNDNIKSNHVHDKKDEEQHYISTRINREHNARVPLEVYELQRLHPNEPNIVVCKNPVACYVKGRLQLTRSLGDAYLKYPEFNGTVDRHRGRHIPMPYTPPYVSHIPDIHHIRLDKNDRFVILATDGVWDYLSEYEAVNIVGKGMRENISKDEIADRLITRALEIAAEESGMTFEELKALPIGRQRRSRHDDTTAVVMFF